MGDKDKIIKMVRTPKSDDGNFSAPKFPPAAKPVVSKPPSPVSQPPSPKK